MHVGDRRSVSPWLGWLCAVVVSCGAAEAGAEALSPQALAAYGLLEVVDPHAVPDGLSGDRGSHFCATPLALAAVEAMAGADPLTGKLLARALQRPAKAHDVISPEGHFRLHYDVVGGNAVNPTDLDENGVPDYVDLAASVADSVWRLQMEILGYRAPPTDGDAGGGPEVDIYLQDLSRGRSPVYGITYPMGSGYSGPSFFAVDNDFTDPIYGSSPICPGHRGVRGTDALRVTIAHELFHVVQFGYYQGGDGSWWQEASATWMEDVAFPDLNDYFQYVCSFLLYPGRALDSGLPSADNHAYGASVFAHFLDQRYGRDLVRMAWEEHRDRRRVDLDNFDRALVDYNGTVLGVTGIEAGIERAFSDFGVWSWFVGDRFRSGFFAEGSAYPSQEVSSLMVAAKAAVSDVGRLDHMATRYIRFEPRLLPGGVTIDTEFSRGRWRRRLLLAAPDSVEIRDIGIRGAITLSGWDAYDEVVLVISNVDVLGIGYGYELTVEYDPDLRDVPKPLAMALEPGRPNPFVAGRHPEAVFGFELSEPSQETRFSVYAADGQLVWRYQFPGPLSARRHAVRWDGTNEVGSAVGSGVYYAVLEADGVALRGALAVIREQ